MCGRLLDVPVPRKMHCMAPSQVSDIGTKEDVNVNVNVNGSGGGWQEPGRGPE